MTCNTGEERNAEQNQVDLLSMDRVLGKLASFDFHYYCLSTKKYCEGGKNNIDLCSPVENSPQGKVSWYSIVSHCIPCCSTGLSPSFSASLVPEEAGGQWLKFF